MKLNEQSRPRVVVTGIGAQSPLGAVDSFWENLKSGISASVEQVLLYGQSKRANLMQSWQLHQRFHDRGLSAVTAHPGHSRTAIFDKMHIIPSWFQHYLATNTAPGMSVEDGAKMQLYAAFGHADVIPSGSHVVPKYWIQGAPILVPSLMVDLLYKQQHTWLAVG